VNRQGAGEVFSGSRIGQGGARMRWPAGAAHGKKKNTNTTNTTNKPGRAAAGLDGFVASAAVMRLASRRAMAVMLRYMWTKARLRACQESELVASLICAL
jgi:hypothetical protein